MIKKGKFITFEGIDGVGKSSLTRSVSEKLRENGIEVLTTREPGGSHTAETIRNIIVHQDMPLHSEILLMFGARAAHLEQTVLPALARGAWVICDRFTDSSYAYQGGGRGANMDFLAHLEQEIVGSNQPDLTFWLNVPVEQALARTRKAERIAQNNRFENESLAFFHRAHAVFAERARHFPERIAEIDATKPKLNVRALVWSVISARFF